MQRENEKGGNRFSADPLILLVRLGRFERSTYGLEVRCSIQLSYRRPEAWKIHALFRRRSPSGRPTPGSAPTFETARITSYILSGFSLQGGGTGGQGHSVPTEMYCKRARLRHIPVRWPLPPWSVCLPAICRRPALLTGRRLPNAVALRVAPKVRSLRPGRRTYAGRKWRVQGGRRPALLVLCFFGIKATLLVGIPAGILRPIYIACPVSLFNINSARD